MKKRKSLILCSLLGSIFCINSLSANDINVTQQKLTASDGVGGGAANGDYFSYSVAISSNYAIVGASLDDDKGSSSGSAYLFNLNATDINTSQIKLTANDGATSDYFGSSVAISSNYAIVGAYGDDDAGNNSGSAYLFNLNASNINDSQIKLTANDGAGSDFFGSSVAISDNYVIIGAYGDDSKKGSAYLFELNATDINASQIKLNAFDRASDDYFGFSLAIDGNYTIVGAYYDDDSRGSDVGNAYIFELNATDINASQKKLTAKDGAASDQFGYSVSMSKNWAIIGAFQDDDTGVDSGSAYLFELNTSDINASQIKLTAKDGYDYDQFSYSVAISNNWAIVGANKDDDDGGASGSAYVYELNASDINASQIKLTAKDGAANDFFGNNVATSDEYAVIGAFQDDAYMGSAYLFDLNNSLPIASSVAISGTVDVGYTLTGSYNYSAGEDDSEVESGTTYQWYEANESNGSGAVAISGATSKTYTITSTESEKYLTFGVTPKDGKDFGKEVNSSYTTMVPVKVDFNSSMARVNSWNMITIPDERNVTVSNISGATIWTFNNSTNTWEKPTTLTAGKGYFLYSSSSIGLVVADKVASTITDDNTTIKSVNSNTWSLVGISKSTSGFSWKEIHTPANSLKTGCSYTQIFYYDSVNSTWNTSTNIPYLGAVWVKQNCFGD